MQGLPVEVPQLVPQLNTNPPSVQPWFNPRVKENCLYDDRKANMNRFKWYKRVQKQGVFPPFIPDISSSPPETTGVSSFLYSPEGILSVFSIPFCSLLSLKTSSSHIIT